MGEVHRDPYGVMSKPIKSEEKSELYVQYLNWQLHVSKATDSPKSIKWFFLVLQVLGDIYI